MIGTPNYSACFLVASLFFLSACSGDSPAEIETVSLENTPETKIQNHTSTASKNTIKLALLLDTSNSMDGLIEQAKSQLWKIVNALSEAKKDGEYANIEIALYEYGNDNLVARNGYVRQVLPFTSDLDTLSQELFALKTNGGEEYCGEVIAHSLDELDWAKEREGLQVIIIAGNEPFDQGETSYQQVCKRATMDGIFINTIFCGDITEGKETSWKDGADIAQGYYGNIDMNEATVYIETPYDKQINLLNASLNETYIPIGTFGFNKVQAMTAQDENASYYGTANSTERVIVKGKKELYKNSSWDLVDASDEKDFDLKKIKTSDLPTAMQTMTQAEREKYLADKKNKREEIQAKIKVLADKRAKYIIEKQGEMDGNSSLENAIIGAIKEQARKKMFLFGDEV